MQDWTFTFGIIALAFAIIGTIATILTVPRPATRVPLFILLVVVGLSAIVMIVKGVANEQIIRDISPTPTPISSPTPSPASTPTPSPRSTPSPTLQSTPSPLPTPSPSTPEPIRSPREEPPGSIKNDIGKSKNNDFYEVTVENATATTGRVQVDNCRFEVPTGQKAILVRFAIRASRSKSLTSAEQFTLGSVKTTDFVLVDERNRRIDTGCQYGVLLISQLGRHANTRTLAYLVGKDSRSLTFRFQKAGWGEAITFDLSGLD